MCTHRAASAGEGGTDPSRETPVYLAGDARTGSSLVVSAIADAVVCAREAALGMGL